MRWILRISASVALVAGLSSGSSWGQTPKDPPGAKEPPRVAEPAKWLTPRLGQVRSETYYIGVLVVAEKGACGDVLAHCPGGLKGGVEPEGSRGPNRQGVALQRAIGANLRCIVSAGRGYQQGRSLYFAATFESCAVSLRGK